MRVMVLVTAAADGEVGAAPPADLLEAMARYDEALWDAGILQAGERLLPSSHGRWIASDGSDGPARAGPNAEPIAGFWLWEVRDMEEAVAWARRCPSLVFGRGALEIRPVFDPEDFAAAPRAQLAATA